MLEVLITLAEINSPLASTNSWSPIVTWAANLPKCRILFWFLSINNIYNYVIGWLIHLHWMIFMKRIFSSINEMVSRQLNCIISRSYHWLVDGNPSVLFLHESSYFSKGNTPIMWYWMSHKVQILIDWGWAQFNWVLREPCFFKNIN